MPLSDRSTKNQILSFIHPHAISNLHDGKIFCGIMVEKHLVYNWVPLCGQNIHIFDIYLRILLIIIVPQ